ncbi:hypothetical protein INS49_013369 [Diaporthe citri]|uniref:uncharacterized protein n=1 Tax=Diaporthe citri TaxID=83186 RepID=UPI001C7FAE2C|nr:uncharacterized protein INS49_013369 [Diaporthe citri]KAG6357492.1 hypothetical protein INS49_013369 [Diaporthe citri]
MVVLCPHCDENGQNFMTYESRIQQSQDWLTKRLENHQACKWEELSPPLPTRVLQLGLGDGSDDVRLLDGQGIQGKYAALTLAYCWGPNSDVIFKTDSTNLVQNHVRIHSQDLNLLFRATVKLLRSLGIMYLWIDALCIVQDSKSDWESEASKMAAVYSNAHLTVSASEATSPDDFQNPQYPIDTRHDLSLHGLEHVVEHGGARETRLDLGIGSDSDSLVVNGRVDGLDAGERLQTFLHCVYFFAADVFHHRTIKELYSLWRPGSPVPLLRRFYCFGSVDMLVSFATTIAHFSSIAELIISASRDPGMEMEMRPSCMDSVIFLSVFSLAGRMIEAYSTAKTGEAVSKLGSLRPNEALLVVSTEKAETQTKTTSIDLIDCGDVVKVVHGGSPPWDGVLLEGNGEFVKSSLTGEWKPVAKHLGDPIYSGTVNQGGPITLRITGASGDSLLDQIIKVVDKAIKQTIVNCGY